MKYILASASPRRRELLEQIGLEFEIIPACGEEVIQYERPEEVVMDLSRQKAEEAYRNHHPRSNYRGRYRRSLQRYDFRETKG